MVSESDLEILEARLDGALTPAEESALAARLRGEAVLAAALEQASHERAMRSAAFRALEPDELQAAKAADRVLRGLRSSVGESHVAGRLGRGWRIGGAVASAAACLMLGVFIGRGQTGKLTQTDKPGVDVREVAAYEVTLRDQQGKIVAVQRFDSAEAAQEFAADLARWQGRGNRLASGQFVLTSDRF